MNMNDKIKAVAALTASLLRIALRLLPPVLLVVLMRKLGIPLWAAMLLTGLYYLAFVAGRTVKRITLSAILLFIIYVLL